MKTETKMNPAKEPLGTNEKQNKAKQTTRISEEGMRRFAAVAREHLIKDKNHPREEK